MTPSLKAESTQYPGRFSTPSRMPHAGVLAEMTSAMCGAGSVARDSGSITHRTSCLSHGASGVVGAFRRLDVRIGETRAFAVPGPISELSGRP